MNPSDPKERLTRLVDLAKQQSLSGRRALAGEITDLLLDWPANYPMNMREPFEVLLERVVHGVDFRTRGALADRIASSNVPLTIVNALIFDAELDTRKVILARNASGDRNAAAVHVKAAALLAEVRAADASDLVRILSAHFGIPTDIAAQILADLSGFWLALLCKGDGLGRAVFSSLAILAIPDATTEDTFKRLAAFDDAPAEGAAGLLAFWRQQAAQSNSKAA